MRLSSDSNEQSHDLQVRGLRIVLFCICVAWSSPTSTVHAGEDPYLGVVADGTISFIGQEFYREFVASWRDMPQVDQFSIAIQERPSARWGSLIWIEYANRQVFRVFLSPGKREYVRLAAREASGVVYQQVIDRELERRLQVDPDLASDEL